MKVLHTAVMSAPMIGVLRQMEAEQAAADKLGLEWRSSYFLSQKVDSAVVSNTAVSSKNRLRFKIAYYRWLWKTAKDFDVILLRYSTFDPLQLLFILACKRPIYSVHHTLEVPELYAVKRSYTGSKVGISAKLYAEKILGALSLSLVDGVIGVLEEIKQYNLDRRFYKRDIPSYVYTNGVEFYSKARFEQRKDFDSEASPGVPVLLFVASVYDPWQGLEELLENASTYSGEFVCHVVGTLNERQQSLLEKDTRFVSHGRRDGAYIADLSAQSDVGLSILAARKKNMQNIPALKVREYLKEGLAVYAGHGDDLPDDYPYYKHGPIDIEEILRFALENRSNDSSQISDSAREYFDKEVLLTKVYYFLSQHIKTV